MRAVRRDIHVIPSRLRGQRTPRRVATGSSLGLESSGIAGTYGWSLRSTPLGLDRLLIRGYGRPAIAEETGTPYVSETPG